MNENKNLPKHWQIKKLGEVADYINGRAFKPTEWEKSGNPIIRIQNLNKSEAVYNYSQIDFEERYKVIKGDLLYAWSASLGVYIWNGGNAWLNQHIFKVVPKSICDKKYLFYALEKITSELYAKAHGSGMVHVTKGKFEETNILLPPLPEQHLIVSKIEELLSDLDNGKQQLLIAQQQLKVYRQSLLKWAFEGKLTNKNLEEGELPKGWHIKILDELSDMCLGKMLDKQKNKGNYHYYLRNVSVRWGKFDLADLEQMRFEDSEIDRFELKKDDLVICEGGEPGRCAIWKDAVPNMKIQKALHRVRVKNMLSVKFLFLYLYYAGMSGLLEKYFTGTTIKHLTGRELKKVEIPLPTFFEQQLIVSELESKLTYCDKIEETISQSLLQAETLRQSILKKAFEGKLVSLNYDSDDEVDKHEMGIAAEEHVPYKKSS